MANVRMAVLMTCHNRAALTLECVDRLLSALNAVAVADFRIYLVDDGSTDGTGTLVSSYFPDVHVIRGSGNLYWAGGMRFAFANSRVDGGQFDAYLLVNDDVTIDVCRAIRFLNYWIERRGSGSDIILVGATHDGGGKTTYSGFIQGSAWRLFDFRRVEPSSVVAHCDTFNANFVVLPGPWFYSRGGLDRGYSHGLADLDLGLDARNDGVPSYVFSEFIGRCERGPTREAMLLSRPRAARARMLFGHPYGLAPELHFARKHRARALIPVFLLRGLLSRLTLLAKGKT